jgi:hypothetical protein
MRQFRKLDEARAGRLALGAAGSGGTTNERQSLLGSAGASDGRPLGADRHDKTERWLTACNFMNGVVGAGIIGLPGAIQQSGLIMGLFLCTLVAVLGDWTIRLLASLGASHGADSYEGLA